MVAVSVLLLILGVTVLEVFQLMQCLFAVEDSDVLGLCRGQTTDGPAQMHEVWLDRRVHRVHADFIRQVVRFASVARAAGSDDVGPVVRATA